MTLTIELHNRAQAWAAIKDQLFPFLKESLQGGRMWLLTLKPETRSQAQNRLMWQVIVHVTFVISGVLLALMDWLSAKTDKH